MKARAVILLIMLLAGLTVIIFGVKKEDTSPILPTVGLEAPEIALRDGTGKTFLLSEFRESVVFINFWASWCQPCKDEMPSIQSLFNQLKDQKRFRMLTVLYRDDYEKAKAYMKEQGYEFPVLMDVDGRSARSYGVTGVPETYVIDKRGVLREKVIGPADWNSPKAISLISSLLQQ